MALLTAWVHHYRTLGIEPFLLGFHFPDHVHPKRRRHVQAACHELGIIPAAISTGPWHEHTNPQLRDALRERSGTGWHRPAAPMRWRGPVTEMSDLVFSHTDAAYLA